jgi:hypothetical protein
MLPLSVATYLLNTHELVGASLLVSRAQIMVTPQKISQENQQPTDLSMVPHPRIHWKN